jgi:hypothetical protein
VAVLMRVVGVIIAVLVPVVVEVVGSGCVAGCELGGKSVVEECMWLTTHLSAFQPQPPHFATLPLSTTLTTTRMRTNRMRVSVPSKTATSDALRTEQ